MAATSQVPIAEASKLFVDSYARAVGLGSHALFKLSDRPLMAKALSAHYGPTMIFVMGGPPITIQSTQEMAIPLEQHLVRFENAGIGHNTSLEKSRIETLGANSAACFLTWKVQPPPDANLQAFSYENLYMFRRGGVFDAKDEQHKVGFTGEEWNVPEGRWEAVFSDNETAELLSRFPDFMK